MINAGAMQVLIGANVAPAMAGMAKVQSGMAATAAKGVRFGAAMSKAVTLPVVAGFALAIKAAADFESSLNDMQAVSGSTDAQMKAVSKTAKQLGADTKLPGTSAKDAADAMVQLAKGGLSANQAMKAARGTLLLSAAAGIDNARAATIQADALNGFGLAAKDANRVADILAASANASTAEIDDMAMSLAQSATVAHQAGWSIEDTATALSMLANAGIKGSDAGTSLKTMLLRLQAPMGAGAKAIEKYGINLRDSSGQMLKQAELAKEFQDRLGGLTKAERDRAMAAIFGTDAIRAGNVLLNASTVAIDRQREASTRSGAAQDLAAAKMKGFNGSLEAFKSAAETAAITIGTILLPKATSLVNGLTSLVGGFESLPPGVQTAIVAFLGAAAVIGPLILLAAKLTVAVKTLGPAFAASTGPVGLFVAAAALALGGILALNGGFGSGASAAQRYRDGMNAATESLDKLKRAALGAEQADLAHQGAILEVKAAQQGLRTVQKQISDGDIKGRDASLALAQAQLRLKQAKLNVKQSSQQTREAERAETEERRKSNEELSKTIAAAREKVRQAERGVEITRGSAQANAKLRDAERDLAVALKKRGDNAKLTASKMEGTNRQLSTASLRAEDAKRKLENIKSRAVKVTVNTEDAMIKVLNLIGQMLQITSKTVTVTVKAKHVKGSWTAQRTLEEVKAAEKGKTVKVAFKPEGTGAVENALKLTKALREAVQAARQNMSSLGGGLSGMIGRGVDAILGRNLAALGNSPEAKRIREIEAHQRAEGALRDRARLEAAVHNAETAADRQQAQAELNDWVLEQERLALAESLATKEANFQAEADARKTAAERGLTELTDSLNRGLIKQKEFQKKLKALIGETVPGWRNLGDEMGASMVRGFADHLEAIRRQAALLSRATGVKFGLGDLAVRGIGKLGKRKPKRAAAGGILRGGGVTDSIPVLAKAGEGVLSHRGMDQLMEMAMSGGGGGGGRAVKIEVTVKDQTRFGMSREAANALARELGPALDRQIRYAT